MNKKLSVIMRKGERARTDLKACEDNLTETRTAFETAKQSLSTAKSELREARILNVMGQAPDTLVTDKRGIVARLEAQVEEKDILIEALTRQSSNIRENVTTLEEELRAAKVDVILDKIAAIKPKYNEAANELLGMLQKISVAVQAMTNLNAKGKLKEIGPELVSFPPPQDASSLNRPTMLLFLDLDKTGGLKSVFPFQVSKESREAILSELLD